MPANCNFHVIQGARENGRFLFACELIEQLHAKGHLIYVHCQDEKDAHLLDDLLWTFKETSFVPHAILGDHSIEDAPIQIGFSETSSDSSLPSLNLPLDLLSLLNPQISIDMLLNDTVLFLSTTPEVPNFCQSFKHISEIVDSDPQIKQNLRLRFQHYRSKGYTMNTQNV